MFLLVFLTICKGGLISPDKTKPIELEWNNQGFRSRYYFNFWIPSDIDSEASVTIDFPKQYENDLGLSSCSSFRITDRDPFPISCSVNSRKLTLTIGTIKAGAHKFEIENIKNPSESGSTGVFQVRTLKSGTVIDENSLYPNIGIAEEPVSLEVSLTVEGALMARYSPIYKFKLTPSRYIPKFSWLRMIFPSDFSFSAPTCYVEEWDDWLGLEISKNDKVLLFSPFTRGLTESTLTFDVYGIVNPPKSGQTEDITLEVLRENTFTVLARTSSVSGPSVAAGTVSKVQITGSPLMTDTPSTYFFTFLPYNEVPEGGKVSVVFPEGYNGLIRDSCTSLQGLKPVAGRDSVTCEVTTDTVSFANFKKVSGQYIKVKVKAYNPSTSGDTGAFAIKTYDADSLIIDDNPNAGHVTISTVGYPEGFSVEMLKHRVDNPIGSYGPIDFFIHPRNYLSCKVPPEDYLEIKIDCPSVIVAGTGQVSCTFGKEEIIASLCKFDSSLSPPQIQIKSPMTGVDCCPLSIKVTTAGVPSGFMIPVEDYGQYKFIARIYDSDGNQLEEAEYIFGTNPDSFSTIDFWYLHYTRDAWNVLKFQLENSVDIPADGLIEWEFQTSNNSFPRDLGWGLQSYETQEFACTYDSSFPDNSPSSIYCEITAGTTKDPVFVRMKGFNGVVSSGVSRWIQLSNVKNAEYSGFVPKFKMRTKDEKGVILNEQAFELPSLIDLPSALSGDVTASSYEIDNPSTEMDFSLPMSASLSGEGWVYIVFPHGYKWDHPNAQGTPINECSSSSLEGSVSDYQVFTQPQAAGILYKNPSSSSVASPFKTCFTADKQSLWIQSPMIQAYVVIDSKVRDYIEINHAAVDYNPTIYFDGAMEKHSAFDKNTTNLWRLRFQQDHRITDGGTIQVLLPSYYFASVNTGCYKIVNSGIRCKGENNFNSNFHRMLILGVTDHSSTVNLPETYQKDPTNVYEVWFYATTGFKSGTAKVEIFSQDEDDGIDKRIDQKIEDIVIDDNLYPFYVSMDSLYTNYIEAYGSESWNSLQEWGPIKIIVKPNEIFPETNTLYNTRVNITFPCISGVRYFTKNVDGLIQCRMKTLNDFMEEGYFGRMCTFIEGASGTPCTPDMVTFYTPEELRIDPSLAAPYDYYEIELNTIGVTDPLKNGFLYPEETGYYRFIVNLDKNNGVNIEQAEPFLYVMEDRFTYLYTTSEHKRIGDANIMMFNFKIQHNITSSDNTTYPGYLLLEFPFDYSGTGAGWSSDLGTGIPDGGKIDCLQNLTIQTIPTLTQDPVYNESRVECFLKYGYYDYTTIIVKNIKSPNPGSIFNLYFGGIINPSKNLYDFPIRIRTVYEDLSNYSNPSWVTLDTKLNTYVETAFNIGGGSGQTTTHIEDDYSRVVNPVHFIPGMDNLTVSFNIENTATVATGTWIWVQVPVGFRLPDWKNTKISLKVINGSTNGVRDNLDICNPSPIIYTWPETRMFKFMNCRDLTVKKYNLKDLDKKSTPNRVEFFPITMEDWPDYPITSKTWVVMSRRSSLSRTNKFPTSYARTSTSCSVSFAGTTEYGYFDTDEIYSFQFTCTSEVPSTGEYIIYFPIEFAAGSIDDSSCSFIGASVVTSANGASCNVVRDTELHISGFSGNIAAGSLVDLTVSVKNPPQGTMSNPYTAKRFVIASYNSTDTFKGSFEVIDRADPAGTAWFTDPNSPSLEPPIITNQVTGEIIYHNAFPLPNGGIGPLEFEIQLAETITKKTGYVVLSTYETISLPTNGQIRCVWKVSSDEYLADNCLFTVTSSTSLPTTIKVQAPTSYDIAYNTKYLLHITTVFADQGVEGLKLESGLVRYGFLIEVHPTGGGVKYAEKRYVELVGTRFPYLSITADQWTQGTFTRISIDFRVTNTVAAGSRLVVEFPTSSSGLFLEDLGLGLTNNEQIPCLGAGSLTAGISCYLFVGSASLGLPVKVIISGFNDISSGNSYRIEFPKIFNPSTGGDEVQISLTMYALDMTDGWPGTHLHYRQVEKIYRVKTNSPADFDQNPPTVSGSDFTFDLSQITTASGDFLALSIHSAASLASSSPTCSTTCKYFALANLVIFDVSGSLSSVTIENIINPLPDSQYLDFVIYHWSKNSLSSVISYASAKSLPITVSWPSKSQLFTSDVMEYLVQFMPTKAVPAEGSVVIEFPSGFNLPESTCYNVHDGSASFMTGTYTCSVSGLTATLSGFDKLATGKNVVVRILAENPSSARTSSGVKVSTFSTTSGSASDQIETNTDSNVFDIVSAVTPSFYEVPRQYKKPVFATVGKYAPVRIELDGFGSILEDQGKIDVTLNGFGTIPNGAQGVCLFGAKRSRCSVSSSTVTVYAPEDNPIVNYPVVLTLTSTNADNIDEVGFEHPANPGLYKIEISADEQDDGTVDTIAVDYIQVFPDSFFSSFSVVPSHKTAEATNLFEFGLKVTTDIPDSGYLRIYFPTKDSWDHDLFENDLGTGFEHGERIPCQPTPGTSNLNSISNTQPLNCKLYHGNSGIGKPAIVEMTGFKTISAGTSISFVLWKVKNPKNELSDAIHIEMMALSLDDSYGELDFFHLNYVMTVTDKISSDPGTPSSPHDKPTTSGSVGGAVDIIIPLMDNSAAIVSGTVFILEFDDQIDLQGLSLTGCTIFETLNILRVDSPSTGAAGPYPTITLTTNTIQHQWSTPVIKCYQWSNFVAQRDGNSYTGLDDLTLATFSSISTSFPGFLNMISRGTVTVVTSEEIPKDGTLVVTFPDDFSFPSPDCEVSGLSSLTNYKCLIDSSVATVDFYESIASGTTLTISCLMKALTDTSSSIQVDSFWDSLSTVGIETKSETVTANSATYPYPMYIAAPAQSESRSTAVKSTRASISFKLKPTFDISNINSDYFTVEMDTAFDGKSSGAELYCTVDSNRVPCEESIADKQFKVYASSLYSITAGNWHEVLISTHFADGGFDGFLQPSSELSNSFVVKLSDGTEETRTMSVAGGVLEYFNVDYLHTTAGQMNVFYFKIRSSSALDGSTDTIVLEFPLKDYNGNELFDYDLGSGKASGELFYLDNHQFSGSVKCILFHGDKTNNFPARVEISGFGSISASTDIPFDIARIKNPSTAGYDVQVSIRAYIYSSGLVEEERTVDYIFAPFEYSTSTSCTGNEPILSSYETEATSTLEFKCCASSDLQAGDMLILEIPDDYSFPSSPSVSNSFTSVFKKFESANWIIIKSSAAVACQSGNPSSTLTGFTNPAYEILENVLEFKAYIITKKPSVSSTTLYKPTMIDIYSFTKVATKITKAAAISISPSIAVTNLNSEEKVYSLLEVTISFTGSFPSNGYFTLELDTSTDPYYFQSGSGIDGKFKFKLNGNTFTVYDFSSISSPFVLQVPVKNPDSGSAISVNFEAFNSLDQSVGAVSITTSAMTSSSYKQLNDQSHIIRWLSVSSLSINFYFKLDSDITNTVYLTLNFGSIFDSTSFTGSFPVADSSSLYNGAACASPCLTSSWTESNKLQYSFSSLSSGVHNIEFSGYSNIAISSSGLHLVEMWLSSSTTPSSSDYYYTFFMIVPSSSGTLDSANHYGTGTSEKSVIELEVTSSMTLTYFFLEFFQDFTSNQGFLSDLGTGLSDGDFISGITEYSGSETEDCVLRTSSSGMVSGVRCLSASFSDLSGHLIYLAGIKNPSGSTTGLYNIYMVTYSSSATTYHSFITNSVSISSNSPSSSSDNPSLSTIIVQENSVWTLTSLIDYTYAIPGDKVLIDFTNNLDSYDLASASLGSGITSMKVFKKNPSIWLVLQSIPNSAIKFSMNNPKHSSSSYSMSCSTFSGTNLVKIVTSSSLVISTGTATSYSESTPHVPTVPFTVAVDLSFTLPHYVPAGGSIVFSFTKSNFDSISCTACISSLTDVDYQNRVSYAITSNSNYWMVTVTNFEEISAGSVYLNQIRVECKTSGSYSIDLATYSGSNKIDIASLSLSVSSEVTLPGMVLLPRLSFLTSWKYPETSSVVDFEVMINPYTTLDPADSSYLVIRFADNSVWKEKDSTASLKCLINENLSHDCSRTTTDIKIVNSIILTSGTLYKIRVFANNAKDDGLAAPTTSGWHKVTILTYKTTPIEDKGTVSVPISSPFSKLTSEIFAQGSSSSSLLHIKLTPSQTISSSGYLVVEFPLYDLETSQELFEAEIGSSQVDGTYFPCEVFESGTSLMSGVTCLVEQGFYTSTATVNSRLVVHLTGSLSSGNSYILGLPGIQVPSTAKGADLVIFSYSGSNLLDYQYLRSVHYVHTVTSTSTVSAEYPTISDSKLMSTGNTFTFKLQPSLPIQTSDVLIFEAKVGHVSITSTTSSSTGNNFLFIYPKAGWIVFQPSSIIDTASSTSIIFTNIDNPSYISSTSSDYIFKAYHVNALTSIRDRGVIAYEYTFSNSAPTPPFDLGTVSLTSWTCLTCTSTNIESSSEVMFKISFDFDLNLPSGSVFEVTFPDDSEEFQSVSKNCEAISAGFSAAASCGRDSGLMVRIENFGSYTAGENVDVYVKALSPPKQISTSAGSVNVYYDADGDKNIGSDTTSIVYTVNGPSSSPDGSAKVYFSMTSATISTRASQTSSFTVSFEPSSTISKSSGTFEISSSLTPSTTSYICKFIDRSKDFVEYISSSCTYSSPKFTISAPLTVNITSGQVWDLEIFTYSLSTNNGLTFPSSGQDLITVNAGSDTFEYYYEVIPAAASTAKVFSKCHTVDFLNFFEVWIETSVDTYSNGGRIEVLFEAESFENDLGTGTTDGQKVDCLSDFDTSSSIYCTLQVGSDAGFNYRPRGASVRVHSQDSDSGKKKVQIANVKNPSEADLNVKVRVRVFGLSGTTETTVIDEMIFYTLGTAESDAVELNEDSFLNGETDLLVGATNSFTVSTDISSSILSSSDYLFWRFPYILASSSITIQEDSTGDSQSASFYLKKSSILESLIISSPPSPDSYTGSITWSISDFENPPYKPLNSPVLTIDVIINNFHKFSIKFSKNLLNHEPGQVTISQLYVSGNSIIQVEGYLNGYSDIDIIFEISGVMGTNLAISIDFPTTFALDTFCQVLEISLSPITGDWVDCRSSESSFILSNINGYSSNTKVRVRGWAKLPNSVGPHTVSIVFYYQYPSLVSYEGSETFSVINTPALSRFWIDFFIKNSNYQPVYAGETDWIYFDVSVPLDLTKNLGFVTFVFEANSFDMSVYKATCEWTSNSDNWQASDCLAQVDSGTSEFKVQVMAPEYHDITAGTWKVTIRGLSGGVYDGITYPSSSYKIALVNIEYSTDGSSSAVLGSANVKVPKDAFDSADIFTYNVLKDSEIIFEFEFVPENDVSKGIPQSGGKSYMLVYFPTVVNTLNCFDDDIGTGLGDQDLMDSFNVENLELLESRLVLGDQASGTHGVFYIRNYTNDLTAGTSYKFYLPWLKNPSSSDVLIHFFTEIWEENNGIYELKVYQEFRYCYDSKNQGITTKTSDVTYSSEIIHALADLGFKVSLTNTISGSDPSEKIVWKLSESKPEWTSNYCVSYTCEAILPKHLILMTPSSQILDQDTLTLEKVPNPDDPNEVQSWTLYIFKNNIIQDKLSYTKTPFSIPEPSGGASVTWRMPDENVENPLINRHDRYLFRFRPSTSIPLGGSLQITFPGLSTDSSNTYSVDNACNPLHGIFGNGGKCIKTSTTVITCSGFQQWDPYMPEIHIECYAINPSKEGNLDNFKVETFDSSGNSLFSKPITASFNITDAPKELKDFRMGWPERTRAPACENRNFADIFVKIVTQRSIYNTGHAVRIYLPSGVALTKDTDSTTYLECYWRNRFNKTPAEFCTVGTDAGQTVISVGVTDQQGLKPYSEYTVHVYTRDTSGGLYQTGVELPAFPEWESWYILATTGSKGDGAKVINEVCPVPWSDLQLRTYSFTVRKWNIWDLTFQPSRDIPVGGGVVVEMRTTNELDQIFELDLGLDMKPLETVKDIGCIVLSGFNSPSPGTIKCQVHKSTEITKKSPVFIYITGHSSDISSSSSHSIRIVKVKNPVQSFSEILNEQLRVHFTVWSFCSTSNTFGTDYARFNLDTLLNIFDYSGNSKMVEPSPAIFNDETISNPITTVFTVYTDPLEATIDLQVDIDTDSSFVIYEFDEAFTLPTTGSANIECNSETTNCDIYAESLWVVWRDDSNSDSSFLMKFLDAGNNLFKSPNYEDVDYNFTAYVIDEGIWAEEHYFVKIPKVNRGSPAVTITHRLSTLHRRTYDIWTVEITPSKGSSRVKRIDLWFPEEFLWLDSECSVEGLSQSTENIYPVSCVSDCNVEECDNHIVISNFEPQSSTGTIKVVLGAMNPAEALTTSDFQIFYYSDLEDTSQVVESWTGNQLVIDDIIYPNDYWVEWPTISINERELEQNSYGEIWFRFRSRKGLSSTKGWYKVILPDDFDIAPSASPRCTIYHKDLPFNNYPDRWSESRTHFEVPQCLYSNKVISIKFTGDVLREFYGIKKGVCTYLVLSTYPSPIDGSEGFKSSRSSGCYSIQFYAMEGSDVMESAVPDICVVGSPADDMTVDLSTLDADSDAILKVEFTTETFIPNGYFYMDGTTPGDQSTILLEFESYMSFEKDLNIDANDMKVFCNGIKGLSPRSGESLLCKLTYGIVSTSPALQHDPALVRVSNFEAISEETFISIHFPVIRTPVTVGDTPQIKVGVYKESFEGQVTWLISRKSFSLDPVLTSLNPTEQGVCTSIGSECYVTNKNIRTRTNLVLYFKASSDLVEGSMIVIQFPQQYLDIPENGVKASVKKNPLNDKNTETYIIDGIDVVTYPEAKMVALTLPGTIYSGEDVDVKLINFTNPSYVDSTGYIKYYSINDDKQIQDKFTTGNIFDIISFTPLKFSTYPVFTSNVFAKGSDVEVRLNFSLVISLESGSSIKVKLPDDYPDLSTITPQVTCQVNFGVCEVQNDDIFIKDYNLIPENSLICFKIFGLLNPDNALVVPQSSDGMTITALDSAEKTIAYAEFPRYRIVDSNPVLRLQVKILPEFYEAGVLTSYTFQLSTMQSLPSGGDIKIVFPEEYNDLPTTERCFTSGALKAFNSCTVKGKTLVVNTFTPIKRYVTFNITLGYIKNPETTGNTSSFSISTSFGGVTLDELDENDPSSMLVISPAPSLLNVLSSRFMPKNEAIFSQYTFVLENPIDINTTNQISMHIQFPVEYAYQLVFADSEVYCESTPSSETCFRKYPRTVVFDSLGQFSESQTMTFNIYAIVNPVKGTTNKLNIQLIDQQSGKVLASDQSIDFQVLDLPGVLNMSSVSSKSLTTHTFSDFLFKFTLEDASIKQNGEVLIKWPGNFHLLISGSYSCEFINSTDPRLLNPECNFKEDSGFRLSSTSTSQEITSVGQELFLLFKKVPTLQEHGNSGNFFILFIDKDAEIISVQSYPNLTPYPNLDFTNKGYRIFINTSEINVYQGAYSYAVVLTLEKPSFDLLKIRPVPQLNSIGVDPEELLWKYAWDKEKSFRVFVPNSVKPGRYLLSWIKTEVNNDTESRQYKPLVNMYINVLPPAGNIPIICEDISYIPLSGSSLPVKVWVPVKTYETIDISLTTSKPFQPDYVKINPSFLNLTYNNSASFFTVNLIYGAVSGWIELSVSGDASGIYYLERSLIPFQTLPIDNDPPAIYSVRLVELTRVSCKVQIKASELVQVFYQLTRKGSLVPVVQMLITGDIMWNDCENHVGSTWTDISLGYASVSFQGLTDATRYVLFIAAVDRAGRTTEGVTLFEFETLPTYLPAKFRIYVKEVSTIEQVLTGTAKALALPVEFLIHSGIDPSLGITRRLTEESLYYELTLFVNRVVDGEKPITYAKNLDRSPEKLKKYVPFYDGTPVSEFATEYDTASTGFLDDYLVSTDDRGNLVVSVGIKTDGKVFGVVLPSDTSKPNSAQIRDGLDGLNRKVRKGRFGSVEMIQGVKNELNFTGLTVMKEFTVYLTAENDLPGNPELIDDEQVLALTVWVGGQTDSSYKFKFKYLNCGRNFLISLVIIIFT